MAAQIGHAHALKGEAEQHEQARREGGLGGGGEPRQRQAGEYRQRDRARALAADPGERRGRCLEQSH
jgi:hypothetical protein